MGKPCKEVKWGKKKKIENSTNSKVKLNGVSPLLTPTNRAEAAAGMWNRLVLGKIAYDSYKWNI